MTRPRVPFAAPLAAAVRALFEEGDVEATVADSPSPPELARMLRDFDGLAVRSASKVDAELLAADAGLNLANVPLGRRIRGGEADSLLRRNAPVLATQLAELRGLAHGEYAACPPFGAAPDE